MIRRFYISMAAWCVIVCAGGAVLMAPASAADNAATPDFDSHVKPFFTEYCIKCHGTQKQKGKLTLHDLTGADAFTGDGDRWERVLDAVASGEMPPDDEKQPTSVERSKIVGWINARFDAHGHVTEWSQKLLLPHYGNAIDHDKLFDGSITEPAYTPSRLWKKSPYIFDSMVARGLSVAKPRPRGRDSSLGNLKQPFTLEDKEGLKDYAAIAFADSATLGTLMRNAQFLVDKLLEGAVEELGFREHGPIPMDQWPKTDVGKPIQPRFSPTADEFKVIVLSTTPQTGPIAELIA